MYLTRTLFFGAVHRLDQSPTGMLRTMGHDYKIDITVKGKVNKDTGIVVNIVDIDNVIKDTLKKIDGKLLDDEVSFFKKNKPSVENLLLYFWSEMNELFTDAKLERIKIEQTPFTSGQIVGDDAMNVYVTKLFYFSTAHRLHSNYISDEENIELFGKCNNLYGHGHNYKLEVTVKGVPDQNTGVVTHYKKFEDIVNENVVELLDHKHINADLEIFKDVNPTSEMLLYVIWDLLYDKIPNLYKIGVWETEKNYFEFYGPDHV